MLDILVIGNGGREYELGRQLSASKQVGKLYFLPGNAGTTALGENVAIDPLDLGAVTAFVGEAQIGIVVIGPEAPLVAGLSDALRAADVPVFGPSSQAAQLEGSKAFASDFMTRYDIPQPASWTARSLAEALAIIKDKAPDTYVLKADGLAGGKGVVLPTGAEEAQAALTGMFAGQYDGAGKDGVVIQERLHGPEVSAFAISDGTNFVVLPFAQDHKRLGTGDQGPNTGGMGAYAPLPESVVNSDQAQKIRAIIQATIDGMRTDDMPYQGVLYVGIMLAEERAGDPVVIEYNCRFGDPETEVVLATLNASGCPVGDLLIQAARGNLDIVQLPAKITHTALTICLAASGYPEKVRKGDTIAGLDKAYEGVVIHQAGTIQHGDTVQTNGGRVLYVTGLGASADEAAARAYAAIGPQGIYFDGMQYRTDIGHQVRTK